MKVSIPRIVGFLQQIGLSIEQAEDLEAAFLPGVTVRDGVLYYEPSSLVSPGDLLHEAGHLALLPPEERARSCGDFGGDGGYEMAAIAWSYAACRHLQMPLELVFHPNGYKGDSPTLIENFSEGRYVGVPILEWKRMASTRVDPLYPRMHHWLCP